MLIRLRLNQEATERLIERAVRERRPVPMQAEVLLLRSLGLPIGEDGADAPPASIQSKPTRCEERAA